MTDTVHTYVIECTRPPSRPVRFAPGSRDTDAPGPPGSRAEREDGSESDWKEPRAAHGAVLLNVRAECPSLTRHLLSWPCPDREEER